MLASWVTWVDSVESVFRIRIRLKWLRTFELNPGDGIDPCWIWFSDVYSLYLITNLKLRSLQVAFKMYCGSRGMKPSLSSRHLNGTWNRLFALMFFGTVLEWTTLNNKSVIFEVYSSMTRLLIFLLLSYGFAWNFRFLRYLSLMYLSMTGRSELRSRNRFPAEPCLHPEDPAIVFFGDKNPFYCNPSICNKLFLCRDWIVFICT